ncbi:DUF397 domain-containing protein [Streptomyces sp. NPDC050255]|uniref:DUF397 domain-containing protein n=1 Tax=Streptomyces sp. NPDC050255 TaxID=3365606 RepID=UPI003792E300
MVTGNGASKEVAAPARAVVRSTYRPLVPVRDSKRPHGPVLLVDAAAWAPFVEAVKAS